MWLYYYIRQQVAGVNFFGSYPIREKSGNLSCCFPVVILYFGAIFKNQHFRKDSCLSTPPTKSQKDVSNNTSHM
jgi:hypothetical protein